MLQPNPILAYPPNSNLLLVLSELLCIVRSVGEEVDNYETPAYRDTANNNVDQLPVRDRKVCDVATAVCEERADDTGEAVAREPEGGPERLLTLCPQHGCEEDESWRNTCFESTEEEADGEEAGEIEHCSLQHADCAPFIRVSKW